MLRLFSIFLVKFLGFFFFGVYLDYLVHIFLKRLETVSPLLVLGTVISIGGVAMVIIGAAAI